jgi:hypothetical protein
MANNSPLAEWDQSPMSHIYETPTARRQVPNFSHQETSAAAKLDPKYVSSNSQPTSAKFIALG